VAYDTLLATALKYPLTSRKQVNDWLRHCKANGTIVFIGLKSGERIPKLGHSHRVLVSRSSIASSRGCPPR
jgi:hypothetical protein